MADGNAQRSFSKQGATNDAMQPSSLLVLLEVYRLGLFFFCSPLHFKSPNEIYGSERREGGKTERLEMESEQKAVGSLQLLALMRIITPLITLAYLREWRGRTSACVCLRVCVWVCDSAAA